MAACSTLVVKYRLLPRHRFQHHKLMLHVVRSIHYIYPYNLHIRRRHLARPHSRRKATAKREATEQAQP